jgi:hypothetical protein
VSSLCYEKDENIAGRVIRLCRLIGGTSVLEEPAASVFRVDVIEDGGVGFSETLVNTTITYKPCQNLNCWKLLQKELSSG